MPLTCGNILHPHGQQPHEVATVGTPTPQKRHTEVQLLAQVHTLIPQPCCLISKNMLRTTNPTQHSEKGEICLHEGRKGKHP